MIISHAQVLDTITNGKIFVEVERARLIAMMADMKEVKGEIAEAATLLQEVQVRDDFVIVSRWKLLDPWTRWKK